MTITYERMRELLSYDPETGIFRSLVSRNGDSVAGQVAGTVGEWGHRRIGLDGRRYMAHRLAWFYMTGSWPKNQIDHRNVTPDDNRWSNLREATGSQNSANIRPHRSGLKGVTFNRAAGRHQAQIKVNGKNKYLGLFDTEAEAHKAYMGAAVEHFGDFARAA